MAKPFGGLGTALRAELFKTRNRRMTYILLGALFALVTLFYCILWLRLRDGPGHGPGAAASYLALREGMAFLHVVPYGLQLERFFLTLIAVVFTATMMGNEYDWRTVGVVMTRGVRRRDFVAAKLITSALFLAAALVVGFVAALVWSSWFSHVYHLPYGSFGWERYADLLASLARTWFVVMPFVLMALLFATIWRSAGQAVGFALGFFFLEGIFTSLLDSAHGFLAHVPEYLLNANVAAVMAANGVLSSDGEGRGGPFAIGASTVNIWQGAGVLLAYVAVFGMVAFWRFQTRDIQE